MLRLGSLGGMRCTIMSPCELDISRLWRFSSANLDDRYRVEHRSSQASRPALPWSAHNTARTIPLRMAMRSDRTSDDDDEEQTSNDASD